MQHIGFAGSYDPTATYRILEGGTGLTGSFDSVASNYAFLDASLFYDRVNYTVDLTLARNDISFADKVGTANQRAAAAAAEAAGAGNAVFNAAAALPDKRIGSRRGLSTACPARFTPACSRASLKSARMLRTTVNNRLRSAGSGGATPVVPHSGLCGGVRHGFTRRQGPCGARARGCGTAGRSGARASAPGPARTATAMRPQ